MKKNAGTQRKGDKNATAVWLGARVAIEQDLEGRVGDFAEIQEREKYTRHREEYVQSHKNGKPSRTLRE